VNVAVTGTTVFLTWIYLVSFVVILILVVHYVMCFFDQWHLFCICFRHFTLHISAGYSHPNPITQTITITPAQSVYTRAWITCSQLHLLTSFTVCGLDSSLWAQDTTRNCCFTGKRNCQKGQRWYVWYLCKTKPEIQLSSVQYLNYSALPVIVIIVVL